MNDEGRQRWRSSFVVRPSSVYTKDICDGEWDEHKAKRVSERHREQFRPLRDQLAAPSSGAVRQPHLPSQPGAGSVSVAGHKGGNSGGNAPAFVRVVW